MSTEPVRQILNGQFELESLLRTDALGLTWRALDLTSRRKVDIRLLPDWVDRQEAGEMVGRAVPFQNAGVVGTQELVLDGDQAGVVMEANDGETMAQRRARRPRRHFEVSDIKPWLRSIVEALGAMHEAGLVHGALYLGSFLIDGGDLKISDVAAAPFLLPQEKLGGRAALPSAAMSPQVLEMNVPTAADDVYALGAAIYDLLTGQPLFVSGDLTSQVKGVVPPSLQDRRAQLEIPSVPFPLAWENWVAAALSKNPALRPSLEDLGVLLRTGQFAEVASSTAKKTAASLPATEAAGGTMIRLGKWTVPAGKLALAGGVTAAMAIGLSVYFLRVKPAAAFKTSFEQAFHAAQQYDSASPQQHAEVIDRWQQFEEEWQTPVLSRQPALQPLLAAAAQKRAERGRLKNREEDRVKEDREQRRKAWIASARTGLDIARIKASAGGVAPAESLTVWREYLTKYNAPYEGKPLEELMAMSAEAQAAVRELETAMAEVQTKQAGFLTKFKAELAGLDAQEKDSAVPAAAKVKKLEETLALLAQAPPNSIADPEVISLKSTAEAKLEPLRAAAARETPAAPLSVDSILENTPYAAYSANGKQRVLKKVQSSLKESGLYQGEPDGTTGKATHEALLAFQNAHQLPPTAALDAAALTKLQLESLTDDASPLEVAKTSPAPSKNRSPGRKKSKAPPPEEKNFLQRGYDKVKKVFTKKKKD